MKQKQDVEERGRNWRSTDPPSALQVISEYVAGMAAQDSERMDSLRSSDFVMDAVQGDAFQDDPFSSTSRNPLSAAFLNQRRQIYREARAFTRFAPDHDASRVILQDS